MSIEKVYAETNIMSPHVLVYFNSSRLKFFCDVEIDKNAKYGFSFRPYIKIYDSIENPDNLKRLRSSINDIGQVKSKGNSYYLLIEKKEEQVAFLKILNFNVSSLLVPNLKQRINLVLKILKQKKIKNLSPEEYIQMGEWADQLHILDLISTPTTRRGKQISIAEKTKKYFKCENSSIAKKMKDYFKSENIT
jgi:hypothetical protein